MWWRRSAKDTAGIAVHKNTGLKDKGEIEEYHATLTKNFLLSNPLIGVTVTQRETRRQRVVYSSRNPIVTQPDV